MSGLPEFPDTGGPDFCLRMLISRVNFSDVGMNCAIDFSAWKMCSRAWMPKIGLQMFAQTLPALPVRPGRGELAGAEGFSGVSPEVMAQLRGRVYQRGRVCRRGRLGLCKSGR